MPQWPLGLGCGLRPRGSEAWGKGRLFLFFFLFLECVFLWSGLWSGFVWFFCFLSCVNCEPLHFLKEKTES